MPRKPIQDGGVREESHGSDDDTEWREISGKETTEFVSLAQGVAARLTGVRRGARLEEARNAENIVVELEQRIAVLFHATFTAEQTVAAFISSVEQLVEAMLSFAGDPPSRPIL